MFPTEGVRIEKSRLGDRAGILGAIALAVQGGVDPVIPAQAGIQRLE